MKHRNLQQFLSSSRKFGAKKFDRMTWRAFSSENESSNKPQEGASAVQGNTDLKHEEVETAAEVAAKREQYAKEGLKIPKAPQLPMVFAHGLMGFDHLGPLQYWRTIPTFLSDQGCKVVVAKVPPTGSIESRAQFLKDRIEQIISSLEEKDAENPYKTELFMKTKKVHLIGHSMGGLDSRYYISCLGGHERTLSLTTIGTPHHGSSIADWSLKTIGEMMKLEALLKAIGVDTRAFHQLGQKYVEEEFNTKVKDHPDVQYYSYAGVIDVSRFSLMRIFYKRLERLEGPNDGLVSEKSAKWGQFKGSFELDHMEQMNWNLFKDVRFLYRDIAITAAEAESKLQDPLPSGRS